MANYFCHNAGFFPNERKLIERYADLLVSDMRYLDVLASWLPAEKQFVNELRNCVKIQLADLEPFAYDKPWTHQLAGKKVLVIHPFQDSILHQWPRRHSLFPQGAVMPEMDLQIMKPVQSIAGNKVDYATWFDALHAMEDEIAVKDFDVALLGCGAYGFNLAAHIKRMGKQAVHLGGVLQIFFGIKGGRWDNSYNFFNEHWIRPLDSDRPQGAETIEKGCYW